MPSSSSCTLLRVKDTSYLVGFPVNSTRFPKRSSCLFMIFVRNCRNWAAGTGRAWGTAQHHEHSPPAPPSRAPPSLLTLHPAPPRACWLPFSRGTRLEGGS